MIQTGGLAVNLDAKTVQVADARVHLTRKSTRCWSSTLTKDMFLNHLYGGMDEPESKIIDRFYVQTAQEARQRLERQGLHRNGVGAPLCAEPIEDEARISAFPGGDESDDAMMEDEKAFLGGGVRWRLPICAEVAGLREHNQAGGCPLAFLGGSMTARVGWCWSAST